MAPIPAYPPDIPSTLLSRAEWDRSSTAGLGFFDKRRFGSLRRDSNRLESTQVANRVDQHEATHESLAQRYNESRTEYMHHHHAFERGDQSAARLGEMRNSLEGAAAIYGQMVTDRQHVAATIETWADQHGYVRYTDNGLREDQSRRNRNGEITALVNRVRGPEDAEQLSLGTRWFQEGLAAINAHQASLSQSQSQDVAERVSRSSSESEVRFADLSISRPREGLGTEPPVQAPGARESVLSSLSEEELNLRRLSDVRSAEQNRPLSIGGALEAALPPAGLSLEQAAATIGMENALAGPSRQGEQPQHRGRHARDTQLPDRSGKSRSRSRGS